MKKNIYKVITAALIGGTLITTGTSVFAKNSYSTNLSSNNAATAKKVQNVKNHEGATKIKAKLDTLVKDGTISQDQEDKMIAFMKQRHEARKAEMDKLKNMTEEQRKAYREKNPKVKHKLFDEMVKSGIISQSQADKVRNVLHKDRGCDKHQHKTDANKAQ